MNPNVYVPKKVPQEGIDLLRKKCGRVDVNPDDRTLSRAELLDRVKGRDGVICMLNDTIDDELMEAAGAQCRVFANYAVGYNNIDLEAARKRSIRITNTPGVLTDATADLAWALLFSAARRTVEADACMRGGKWEGWGPMQFLGQDITGKTLGLVGAGRIGTNFALKSAGFGMKVLYSHTRENPELEERLGARRVELDELLRESDFVSLHVPLKPETRHLIARDELSKMKPSAVLINTARGPVVDEAALVDALKNRTIAAAGLDVYENEPETAEGLLELSNVVALPHIASATFETRSRMAKMAAENLIAVLEGHEPPNAVV